MNVNVIFMLLGVSIVVGFCVYLFMSASNKPIKYVDLLRPRDGRGERLKVSEETDIGLICDKKKGVVHRFIKLGRGWTFSIRGRMVTKFLGLEGTAYTAIVDGPLTMKMPISEYLTGICGEAFYRQIPDKHKKTIEEDKLGITIEAVGIDPKSLELPTLTGDDIFDEADAAMMRRFSKDMENPTGNTSLLYLSAAACLGALLMYFVRAQGYI